MDYMSFRSRLSLIIFALFLSGCDFFHTNNSTNTTTQISITNEPKYFALLGPISDATVTIERVDFNKTIYSTKTKQYTSTSSLLQWGTYTVGSFAIDTNITLPKESWLNFTIRGGEDVDSDDNGVVNDVFIPLQGSMKLYCKVADLQAKYIISNIFTTLAVDFYLHDTKTVFLDKENYLTEFSRLIFRKSLDANEGVDYRDLFAYVPNHTPDTYFKVANVYKNLQENGIIEAVLNNEDVITKLLQDKDDDGLSLWDEVLHNSSDDNQDTDDDGINDFDEVKQGLNPALKDSDYDGIEDNDEKLYGTSALNADTDGDYLPDNVEILNATDPLNADEDGNGIVDGLDGDPFFKYQWYIKSLGNVVANTVGKATITGNDLNILDVYHQVLGNSHNSIVQIVDTGVELKHEDLNVYLADSFNAVTKGRDPTATQTVSKSDPTSPLDSGHGTAVAGIIAAKTNNGLGISGIVPRAKIAGSNWLESQDLGELERVWYSGITDENITVSNNSWGTYYLKDESFERILALATAQLRNGKGRIYVFAAGNDREDHGNSNLSYLANNPYVLTVASLNSEDKYASYSNPGSNILVSAYGGEHYYTGPTIMTTSLMNESYYESELQGQKGVVTVDEDDTKSYTYAMNGTSAATPMVSGSIALVLDACPSLSWRDVRWLVAQNAKLVDKFNSSWITNAAGLHFSNDYGFGKINPMGMIDMCRDATFTSLPPMLYSSISKSYNLQIPDNNTTIIQNLTLSEEMLVEWVGLTIDTTHNFSGDLEINLVSPSGTKVNLVKPNEVRFAGYSGGFRFSSVAFMDEVSAGVWHVEITDRLPDDTGILKSLKLEVYGHEK